jgi:hypothetical protein
MPLRRAFLEDARTTAVQTRQSWEQVCDSWRTIATQAEQMDDQPRRAKAQTELGHCAQQIAGVEDCGDHRRYSGA